MAEVRPTLGPQAALETAMRDLIRARLGYLPGQCERTLDELPWPSMGDVFVSVWSDAARSNDQKLSLHELLGVNVTVTVKMRRPADRQVEDRDELARRVDAIRALAARDRYDRLITNAANALAALTDDAAVTTRHVGFCAGLCFARLDAVRKVGPEYFGDRARGSGLAQTIVCDRALWIQAIPTAV